MSFQMSPTTWPTQPTTSPPKLPWSHSFTGKKRSDFITTQKDELYSKTYSITSIILRSKPCWHKNNQVSNKDRNNHSTPWLVKLSSMSLPLAILGKFINFLVDFWLDWLKCNGLHFLLLEIVKNTMSGIVFCAVWKKLRAKITQCLGLWP